MKRLSRVGGFSMRVKRPRKGLVQWAPSVQDMTTVLARRVDAAQRGNNEWQRPR